MRFLTLEDFRGTHWPASSQAQVDGILKTQADVLPKHGIVHAIHLAHLMAQLSHESGAGTEMVESLNYSAAGLLCTFPTHVSVKQAQQYGRTSDHPADQRMIGNLAYGSRMGNRPGTYDGYNFRGRGFIQTTGRESYNTLVKLTGLDVLNHPDLVNDPAHAFDCAVAEFVHYPGMLAACDADNILKVTRLINGGTIGLGQREMWLSRWKAQLGS